MRYHSRKVDLILRIGKWLPANFQPHGTIFSLKTENNKRRSEIRSHPCQSSNAHLTHCSYLHYSDIQSQCSL